MAKIDISRYVEMIQAEINIVSATFREKGANRFGRALALGLSLPCAAYLLAYAPANRKLSSLDSVLAMARTTAERADTYKELKDRLSAVYTQLPPPKDRGNWLSDTVKEALRSEGIVPTQFKPPQEEESSGVVVQNLSIVMSVKFAEMMSFLARLEATKPLVQVTSLDLSKKEEPQLGRNDVNCSVSTIILTERY